MPMMTDVELGQELAAAIARRRWTNREFARQMPVDSTLVSKWIHGAKPMTRHQLQRAVMVLDDFTFCLAVARYASGGVLGVTLDAVDGGRAGAALCVAKEIAEAQATLAAAHAILIAPPDDNMRESAIDVALALLELSSACKETIARLCQSYGLGASEMAFALAARLREQGYVTRSGHPAGNRAAAAI